jgi:hypothetical protein
MDTTMPPRTRPALSKSKLLAYRQCPKRLWLELHRQDLRQDSAAAQASFTVGHQVGDIARRLYDPKGSGQRYYHPSQQGSWSIKKVLPAIAPDLRYEALEGVQDGGIAMDAFCEAIAANTSKARKAQIEEQLLDYCCLDTLAMVRLWTFFTGYRKPNH